VIHLRIQKLRLCDRTKRGNVTTATAQRLFSEMVIPHLDDALTLARWLTGNSTDAEDVVQEACLRAFRALEQAQVERPRAWLLAITRNAAFTWLARNRPKDVVLTADPEMEETSSLPGGPETPEEAAIATADAALLEKAITDLPQAFRESIVMREINGMSYREIAEVTNAPIGTVMSRLARARNLLLVALADCKP
jgi:RNA polymerase sigma factor (sigma-70 family)